MTERLATWVWVGASALALVAGMVNVVGYLGFEHQAITHLTGTTSLLGAALAQGNLRSVLQLAGMLLAFMLGAVLSGLLIKDSVLQLGRRYGVALAFEAMLLVLAADHVIRDVSAFQSAIRVALPQAETSSPSAWKLTPGCLAMT